jgi:hypothetical protein
MSFRVHSGFLQNPADDFEVHFEIIVNPLDEHAEHVVSANLIDRCVAEQITN